MIFRASCGPGHHDAVPSPPPSCEERLHDPNSKTIDDTMIVDPKPEEPDNAHLNNNPPICDACPHCSDVCLSSSCSSCHDKLRDIQRLDPSSAGSCLPKSHNIANVSVLPLITPCHVRRHNTITSPWLRCNNDIYDASDFIQIHPGGERCILQKAGGVVDCTRDLMFHSSRGKALWKERRVGILTPCRGSGGKRRGAKVEQEEKKEQSQGRNGGEKDGRPTYPKR